MAIDRGPKDIILDLLCRGANAQTRWANGRTALHHAMVRRGSDILLELVARGGDVNAATTAGDRPLHGAAQIGNIHALIFLLGQPGIDINAQNNRGETPLHKALTGKRSNETVRMLLNAGALQDIVDKSGRKAIG
ncbi:ankyrin repeat-containing domain protein [Pestalotiopsis sp. NC0098]|nr:ankyrin repeat-containing domain protein [Pestalotiopsis sp. NC0098]